MGGAIALQLALLMPNRVSGVTLLSPLRPDGLRQDGKSSKIETLQQVMKFQHKAQLYEMA